MKCKHLTISDEAYCNDVPSPVFLCSHVGPSEGSA